ncbi:MAG: hypothetical protein HY711_07680 [Candidatus Melainabacteria bacterium]|nr:hypothetical protein [Candidatus Melainabacteria bacterium]
MAIQLNERDHLIFKLIEEHQVLLEKHISWFIASDQKPVLIRDRLRKLFYLDYLLCQRHKETLPWWTTPTKPLVYTLSPMTRSLVGADEIDLDLNNGAMQRHLLEVANLRMLLLVDERDGLISNFRWTTCTGEMGSSELVDAKVSFVRNGVVLQVGIMNHPSIQDDGVINKIKSSLAKPDIEMVWVISRDDSHQQELQKGIRAMTGSESPLNGCLAFATHQELYKSGMVRTVWQNLQAKPACIFIESIEEAKSCSFAIRPQIASA